MFRVPAEEAGNAPPPRPPGKQRGAPQGHPGWFRPTPTHYDELVHADAPCCCPHCGSDAISVYQSAEPADHLQEDVLEGLYQVTLFRHPVARCRTCRRYIQEAAEGEILGSHIGPHVRSMAVYLRNEIGITYRRPGTRRIRIPGARHGSWKICFNSGSLRRP